MTRSIANARNHWDTRSGILVVLEDEDGNQGLGEASPLPGFSVDTVDECVGILENIERRLNAFDAAAPIDDVVQYALAAIVDSLSSTPSAQFALETALLDLVAQARGCSIAECLAGGPPSSSRIECNAVLASRAPLDTWPDAALEALNGGIRTLKVKVGAHPFEDELESLERVVDAANGALTLRLDANGAWSVDEAREYLRYASHLPIEFIEQPVSADALPSLGPCSLPWAADESLAVAGMADVLLGAQGCAVFVIKPPLLGGLLSARRLAVRAQQAGLGVVVTHVFDGPVALLAAFELAISLPRPPLACGLDRHDGLSSWPHVDWPNEAPRGFMVAGPRIGLGIDRGALLRVLQ